MLAREDLIFANLHGAEDAGLAAARKRGAWKDTKTLLEMPREEIIDAVKRSGLRGRGGAGFPPG